MFCEFLPGRIFLLALLACVAGGARPKKAGPADREVLTHPSAIAEALPGWSIVVNVVIVEPHLELGGMHVIDIMKISIIGQIDQIRPNFCKF